MAFALAVSNAQPAPVSAATEPNAQVSKEQAGEEQAAVQWMRQNAIPLETVEAGHGFADLQALGQIVGNARIVELGEATHGTREFFQLKHRIIEYLAAQKGFTIFSIEGNMPEAYRLNDYVLHGVGDPKQLLGGLYFWTWNTQEVLDMILWMREFNQSGKGRIEFTGFDMQFGTLSVEAVRHFVQQYDPAWLPTLDLDWKDVAELQHMSPGGSASFGVATATFPLAAAAGHHIRFSGYIKTENITYGYAGLWWRVDGDAGKTLAFDNMRGRGAKGTTSWTPYEISLDVPADARKIVFGVLHPGNGTAWFDSLAVEVDGAPYSDPSSLDLDFESPALRGFEVGGQGASGQRFSTAGYSIAVDKSVAHTGAQSLRSQYTVPAVDAGAVDPECKSVIDYLTAHRAAFIAAGATAGDADWAIQNATIVRQFAHLQIMENSGDMNTASDFRDESMAENIRWIADHNPGAKIVVWAHNAHVSWSYSQGRSLGGHLHSFFGPQVMNFGFAFNQGSFRAVDVANKTGVHPFTVSPAPEGTLDAALAATGIPAFALDLRALPKDGPVAAWFAQPHQTRDIGADFSDASAPKRWTSDSGPSAFDAILFVNTTTSARPN
ncbi:MAG: erythromycin esterase family protein [Terracidiphilus sp.]